MRGTGILFGLLAATLQSASYICSRVFVRSREAGVARLLIVSHILMGAVSLAALPLVWHPGMPALRTYLLPFLGVSVFYIGAQAGLFILVRVTEASRVVPLLGFKIVVLACISVFVLGRALSGGQWIAVGLSFAAALSLNFAGRGLGMKAWGWLLVTCLGYSLSDLSIEALVNALHPISPLRASVIAVCMSYALCGTVAVLLLPVVGHHLARPDWLQAAPFAFCWLSAMACLFTCFGAIGAVHGNVLQSTRGLISVLVGATLARFGHVHIEAKAPRRVVLRRAVAASLMVAAIWMFGRSCP